MLSFFVTNAGTLAVALGLVILLTGILLKLRHDRKKGGSCGCGCENCALRDSCTKSESDS